MGRVVHFELYGEDAGALASFYRDVFGWFVEAWEGPFEYYLVGTGEGGPGIDGAIAPFGGAGQQRTIVTVDVDDIEAVETRVREGGGWVVTPKDAVPGVGWVTYVADPQGGVVGLLQSDPEAGLDTLPTEEADRIRQAQAERGAGAGVPPVAPAWDDVGERLRDLGASIGRAFGETTSSPQAQRVREEAEKAGAAIREASQKTAERARPYVLTALERVSEELDGLAQRLRRDETEGSGGTGAPDGPQAPPTEGTSEPAPGTGPETTPSQEDPYSGT